MKELGMQHRAVAQAILEPSSCFYSIMSNMLSRFPATPKDAPRPFHNAVDCLIVISSDLCSPWAGGPEYLWQAFTIPETSLAP